MGRATETVYTDLNVDRVMIIISRRQSIEDEPVRTH